MTKTANALAYIAGLIMVVVPFHAFLTVWLSSKVGHYTLLRLWDEGLLAILAIGAAFIFWRDKNLKKAFKQPLAWLIAAYFLVTLIWAVFPYTLGKVTAKAVGYGLIVNLRYLIFFLSVWVVSAKSAWLKQNWPKLIFWPAAAVCVFGILQALVLPYDFLRHFGYNGATIFPYETVNHNLHYIRAMSFLRGANPLGAYLLVVASTLIAWLIKKNRKWWGWLLLLGAVFTLALSYSREAWLGMAVSLITLAVLSLKNERLRRMALASITALVIILAGVGIGLRHNATIQNLVLHTQSGSKIATTSNAAHASALKQGLHDLVHQPLGQGVGTAGPASVYNNGHSRVADNYFVQIGQELGWLGLVLFAAIYISMGWQLWLKRQDYLALALAASFIGIAVVCLFSHAWTDDTLAYLWWGLAGICFGADILKNKRYGRVQKQP